jgi:hypothetical protein
VIQGRYVDRYPDWSGPGSASAVCHKFTLESGVSAQTPNEATVTWTDGASATYPAISARDLFNAMNPTPPNNTGDCANVAPLAVTGARLATDTFSTDRGPAQMSAWVFRFSVGQTWSYPAIALTAFWAPGTLVLFSDYSAILSSSGESLNVGFHGFQAGTGSCGATYAGFAAESAVAVAVIIASVQIPAYGCKLQTANRFVNVALKAPVAGRVVVDVSGNVIVVCPANPKPGSPACYQLAPNSAAG